MLSCAVFDCSVKIRNIPNSYTFHSASVKAKESPSTDLIVKPCEPFDLQSEASVPDNEFKEPRVVIIGAGIAGLSAAARLAERGITNFVVLEAYERPGGRIHSRWIGDVVAELGAHWPPSEKEPSPIYTMRTSESPPKAGSPGSPNPRDLFSRAGGGEMDYPPLVNSYYKFKQIQNEAKELFALGGSKLHGSMIQFLSQRISQEVKAYPEAHQQDAARIMFGLAHMMTARSNYDMSMMGCDNMGCYMNIPGSEIRVPLGMFGLLAPILRAIPEGAIKCCKPVNCIYWGAAQKCGYRAVVTTCDGDEYPADYVINTMPLGVLSRHHLQLFCPALPATKVDAMRCLGFGYCNKIYLEYCQPIWYWCLNDIRFKFQYSDVCSRQDWTKGIDSIELVRNSHRVICAWVVGPEAMAMEALSDKDVAEGVTAVLRASTGDKQLPYPSKILRSYWSMESYFQGAYSFNIGESDGAAQSALAAPLPGLGEPVPPILLFAGEATAPGYFATVAGARLSGIREAERIVELTAKMRGPPLPKCPNEPIIEKCVCEEEEEDCI